MLKKNDCIELAITDVTQDANGVGKYQSIAVFVPFAAVGDVLRVKIVQVRARYCFGIIEEIITPSPSRLANSGCPVFGRCGGCSLRHIDYPSELQIKEGWVRENFRRIGKIDAPHEPIVPSPQQEGYRNKAIYPVARIEGKPVIGFYAKRSHRVIPIEDCPLHPHFFADITNTFVHFLQKYDVSIYDEIAHKGLVRALFIRYAEATGQVMIAVIINGGQLPHQQELVGLLLDVNPNISSVLLNHNTEKTNVLLGECCTLVFGSETITDRLCGIDVSISCQSFYQVNRQGAERLYAIAKQFARLTGNEILLDLYCGAGTIGLSMADSVRLLIGAEIVPEAVENAGQNAKNTGLQNARFLCADAAKAAETLQKEGVAADVVIVDPPRKGLTPELIQIIAEIEPYRVVMVSCDSATAARDAALFAQQGYITQTIRSVDMFPRTGHVECVCLLEKRKPGSKLMGEA